MKKLVSYVAIAAFMFSINAFAGVTQEQEKKKEKAKTEKSSTEDKKECGTEKKGGCCSSKKAEAKKNMRSMNGEIIAHLQRFYGEENTETQKSDATAS